MKSRTLAVLVVAVLLTAVGAYAYYNKASGPEGAPYATLILSDLGALDCYSYIENSTVEEDGNVIKTSLEGGYFNGTYYFHGKRPGFEWYIVLQDRTANELVITNGTKKNFTVWLTREEAARIRAYDPVKVAIQAVGAGTEISRDSNNATYQFSITLPPSDRLKMNGTITVELEDKVPVSFIIDGDLILDGEKVEHRTIKAILRRDCSVPEWVKDLEG